jgi:FkbM family methyltransferase
MEFENFVPKADAVCVDVGANIGSTALAWTRTLKRGKIYAIEPHPETYRILLRNIGLNGATDIILPRQIAVGSNDGESTLLVSDQGTMAMRPGNYKWQGREISTPLMTLDSFIEKEGIKSIDILKIDIEGFEAEALEGASETLNMTKNIVLEYHSPVLRKQCLAILSSNEFQIKERRSLIFGSKWH